jgi:hypothetical protein
MQQPILVCFDVDGTLAIHSDDPTLFDRSTDDGRLMRLRAQPNLVQIAMQYLADPNVEVMFCTGRAKSLYGVTWRWLNRYLNLAVSGKPVTLVCRPDDTALNAIPQFKLSELVQAIRRQPQKLAELRCYDDSVENLRLFQTLAPTVKRLRLYRVDDGVATQWSL